MARCCNFDIVIDIEPIGYDLVLEESDREDIFFETDVAYLNRAPEYTGTYEVTPSRNRQVLITEETTLTQNIVVNAIPSNYGLITWNGSVLTVS